MSPKNIGHTILQSIYEYYLLIAACECVTYTGYGGRLSGTFTSPNYPDNFNRGVSCILYIFEAPENRQKIVEVMFTDLDLGSTPVPGRYTVYPF